MIPVCTERIYRNKWLGYLFFAIKQYESIVSANPIAWESAGNAANFYLANAKYVTNDNIKDINGYVKIHIINRSRNSTSHRKFGWFSAKWHTESNAGKNKQACRIKKIVFLSYTNGCCYRGNEKRTVLEVNIYRNLEESTFRILSTEKVKWCDQYLYTRTCSHTRVDVHLHTRHSASASAVPYINATDPYFPTKSVHAWL